MASQISTSAAIALISQLLYEIQSHKADNNSIRLAYQSLQHDLAQRDIIISEQAKLLQSAGFGVVSKENPATPNFVESQLETQSRGATTFAGAPQLAAIPPTTLEETKEESTGVLSKKRKMTIDSDRSTKKDHARG